MAALISLPTVLRAMALATAGLGWASAASATAMLGGTLDLGFFGGGVAGCGQNASVPTTTLQDTFALSAASPPGLCDGQSASGELRADAASASVGLKLSASGPRTVAAGQVSFVDTWRITPAPGAASGPTTLPVSFSLEGAIAPGSFFAPAFGHFLSHVFVMANLSDGGLPFQATGQVSTTGTLNETFAGSLALTVPASGARPIEVQVLMTLSVPHLDRGEIDVFNTAQASLALPAGWSATTSSGLALVFAPVPEPGAGALLLAGLGLLALRRRA